MTRLFAIFLFNTMIANAGVEEYLRNIKPVLKERCYACHGALKQKAGLRVDSAENLRKGSKGGDVLALGQAEGLNLPMAAASKGQFDTMIEKGIGELDKSGVAELTFKGRTA